MTEGFITVAIGEECRRLAAVSLAMLRKVYPATSAHVITDQPFAADASFEVVPARPIDWSGSRHYKTRLPHHTPFDVAMYIDADACVLQNFGSIESILDGADIAICEDARTIPNLKAISETRVTWGKAEEIELMRRMHRDGWIGTMYNCGVFAFRRDRCRQLFDQWHTEWKRFSHVDQYAFIRAYLKTHPHLNVLPPSYNWREPMAQSTPYILHHQRRPECIGSVVELQHLLK